jgi:polyhydroxyalkanoate synthesis regulator protein
VKVVDAASGEDLTRLVLTQIIVEHAKGPESAFPLDVLRQMVVASGKATQENAMKYMRALVEMYQSAFRAMSPALNPFDLMRPFSGPAQAPPADPSANAPPEEPAKGPEAELRRRLEELESMVSRLKRRKKTPARKSKAGRK